MSYDPLVLSPHAFTQAAQSQPTDPIGTTSLVGVMMGLAILFTPRSTGRIKITVDLTMAENTTADGATVQAVTGTGAAPANGAAATGTLRGKPRTMTYLTGVLSVPCAFAAFVTGLVVGVQIWVDLNLKAVTGGTATVSVINIIIEEY